VRLSETSDEQTVRKKFRLAALHVARSPVDRTSSFSTIMFGSDDDDDVVGAL